MSANITAAALALASVSIAGSACAMNPQTNGWDNCRVANAEKLPPESGGAEALCTAIAQAAASAGLKDDFGVEVRVLSPSMLSAVVTTQDGRRLPEQKLATADRELRKSSFERFARTLVQLAQADRR